MAKPLVNILPFGDRAGKDREGNFKRQITENSLNIEENSLKDIKEFVWAYDNRVYIHYLCR